VLDASPEREILLEELLYVLRQPSRPASSEARPTPISRAGAVYPTLVGFGHYPVVGR
jgi:hypothetical protein